MDWHDDEMRQPWEQGGDLPWTSGGDVGGWSPPDPEAWREPTEAELPSWPELVSGAEVWQQELDDDE